METPLNSLRKGSWTAEEDSLLKQCVDKYGEGKWHLVPSRSGLNRCRKSCRLRWLNYLKPSIKRGRFSSEEVDLIVRLHRLLGNRWSLIAGRIPGRTANDIKNYWNTHLSKKQDLSCKTNMGGRNPSGPKNDVTKPPTQSFSDNGGGCSRGNGLPEVDLGGIINMDDLEKRELVDGESMTWWESLLEETGDIDAFAPAATAANEAGTSSSTFDFEKLWSLFNEDTRDLD